MILAEQLLFLLIELSIISHKIGLFYYISP